MLMVLSVASLIDIVLTQMKETVWVFPADVRDTGRELTDEEWAQFFANELGGDPEDVSGDGKDGEDDSPLSQSEEDLDLPPSFADDEVKPGVRTLVRDTRSRSCHAHAILLIAEGN